MSSRFREGHQESVKAPNSVGTVAGLVVFRYNTGMGFTTQKVTVRSSRSARASQEVEFLVDSGAVYSLVPAPVLRKLGLRPYRTEVFALADGTKVKRKVGDYAAARPLYERALAIREKALRPEHPDVAESLNNLAAVYYEQGQYAKAEPLYQRARTILEKAGPEHPDVATCLENYNPRRRYPSVARAPIM